MIQVKVSKVVGTDGQFESILGAFAVGRRRVATQTRVETEGINFFGIGQ